MSQETASPIDNRYHLTLLRHAESLGNAEGYHQGQAEFPLTDHGISQANFAGPRFRFQNSAFATATYILDQHQWYLEGINERPHVR